jgi:hypothetical protein
MDNGGTAKFDRISPNFSFQPGGDSVIKWRMQTIGNRPRRAFAKLHQASHRLRSGDSRGVAISTVSQLKENSL